MFSSDATSKPLNISVPLIPQQHDNTNTNNTNPLLPLQEAQKNLNILKPELHLALITIFQAFCSDKKIVLALDQVNKQAFAMRFKIPWLQHVCFQAVANVNAFLAYLEKIPDKAKPNGAVRTQADFQEITTLTLSDQLHTEQCKPLFAYLSGIKDLKIRASTDTNVRNLGALLTAAPLSLQDLNIIQTDSASDSRSNRNDTLPSLELWKLSNLQKLTLEGLNNIKDVSEELGQLSALMHLHLEHFDNLTALPTRLEDLKKLKTIVLSSLPKLQALPKELASQLKHVKISHLK